jgi:hypothetical protein
MAKVSNPLMSLTAKGSFGKRSITFRQYAGDSRCSFMSRFPKANAPAQLAQQDVFKRAHALWLQLTPYTRSIWEYCTYSTALAYPLTPYIARVSGKQLFMRHAIHSINTGLPVRNNPYEAQRMPCSWSASVVYYF